ncbi:hypothetical protein GCM10010172_83100 [Paractinoplanes ferrugineus]|uniref:Uncharacterized protein n=1 Tax=Paractinoplanes ferrugineus TaxID=113564 RepID=A0A919IX09_9ACTN|nr:hypothetical protein [Actinoplanes ferrugineus]GIE10631.1 hypothetical protein Afe05nite_24710 [Actinoplanes ferrugineus]
MTDDDLRDRMRRADPAAALAPLPPDRVARLLEETVSVTAPPTRRRVLLPVLAAAAVLLLAGAGWLILRPSPTATNLMIAYPSASAAAPPRHLTAPAEQRSAKCRPPEASRLTTTADFAFAGTVTGIDARHVVTLSVTKVYRGDPASQVLVDQTGDSSETMMGSGRFEIGKSYLIASAAGTVLICGYSGEAGTPGLLDLYEEAF